MQKKSNNNNTDETCLQNKPAKKITHLLICKTKKIPRVLLSVPRFLKNEVIKIEHHL